MDLLRRRETKLVRLAANDLSALFAPFDSIPDVAQVLNDTLPALVLTYGQAAASVAADWYDDTRTQKGVRGRFTAIPADIKDPGTPALIGWALKEANSLDSMQTLIAGGMQRRILDFGRQTVMDSSYADPQSRGWQREGIGECDFCNMLIGRGAVYSEDSADFAAHDHCKCFAVPAFLGEPLPVRGYTVSPRRTLDDDGNPVPDADFDRAKAWIADHYGDD